MVIRGEDMNEQVQTQPITQPQSLEGKIPMSQKVVFGLGDAR